MADFAQILIRAKDDTKGAFDSAARNMRGLEAGAAKLRGLMGTIGIGAGLSAAGFAAFAKSSIDAADNLNDMSQRLGVSVKDLASFKLAAEQSGTSLEGVGNGIARLTRSIGEAEGGNKNLAKALQDLGVTARDPREAFYQLADATARIADPAKRAALLSQVLGKSYQDLIPLLSQGGDEMRRSALASESFADAMARLAPDADRFNDQLAQIKINAAGVAAGLVSQVVPSLNEYLGALQKITHEGTAMEKLGFFTLGFIPAHILDEQASSAQELGARIASYRQRIAELTADGKDASAEIATMNRLLEKQIGILNKPPKRAAGTVDTSAATSKTKTGSKTDPLASLLGSTDIGRTQEYNRLLGLLDARFAGGKKNAELYAQAVTKLNEQFGKAQIDVFDSGSFKTTNKDVAAFIREQQDAINGLNSEMAQDGVQSAQQYQSALDALLGGTTIAKTEALQASVDVLNRAFFDGTIGAEQYDEAIAKLTEGMPEKINDAGNAFRDFGMIMVSSLEEAIVSGGELGDMLDGLEKDLLKMGTRKMVTDPLSKWIDNFDFGSLSLPGSDQNLLGSFASLFGFDGGGYTGDGSRTGGLDGKGGFVAMLHPRETVVDHTRGQSVGGTTVVMNISTPDANSFRASRGQITAQMTRALQRGRRFM